MVIASQFEGRVRIRDEELKQEPVLSRVREALLTMPGVDGVEANQRVGSLLVLYNAAVATLERITKTIADLIGAEEAGIAAESGKTSARPPAFGKISLAIPPAVKRKVINIGMLASLALSLFAAILDLKKLHILAGIVFVALFGDHLFERRQMIFA